MSAPTMSPSTDEAAAAPRDLWGGPKPILVPPPSGARARLDQVMMATFIVVPLAALAAAAPVAWGWGLGWHDIVIALAFYFLTCLGVTVGYHRYFTHGSFKAKRPLRIALAVAGSLAIQGPVIRWVADHRRHHAYSDDFGDPHSPWRFGTTPWALARGFLYAHVMWLFDIEETNQERFTPDLLADRDIVRVHKSFPAMVAVSMLAPALIGFLWGMSWQGAVTAFFWASLVRVSLLHHVTWSINSICHTIGEHPFKSRDKAGNVWWLAIASCGESWHNLHHADPTAARHGVLPGQVDISARTIWIFEKLGWAYDARWPSPERIQAKLATS
jgi:stearoyl-CoA desaturase (delta-9 desaturase)